MLPIPKRLAGLDCRSVQLFWRSNILDIDKREIDDAIAVHDDVPLSPSLMSPSSPLPKKGETKNPLLSPNEIY